MLKYRFYALYKDGTVFQQNDEDVSVQDTKRSAFYDVDQSQLAAFLLKNEEHGYAVNLIDGSFCINGAYFSMYEGPLENIQLIFFRRHTHTINAQHAELAHQIVYRLGWQATSEGESIQRVMEIS